MIKNRRFKTIENKYGNILIEFDFIDEITNICPISKRKEKLNITVKYVPKKKLIDAVSYRAFFKQEFNCFIEGLTDMVFEKIVKEVDPRELEVKVFLTDKTLRPWSCSKKL